jgi:nitric oxide reductase large subunit
VTAFLWIGAALAAIGVAGLGWCIRRAAQLRRSDADRDETQRVLQTLVAANFASVAFAFLGLALMVAGALL